MKINNFRKLVNRVLMLVLLVGAAIGLTGCSVTGAASNANSGSSTNSKQSANASKNNNSAAPTPQTRVS